MLSTASRIIDSPHDVLKWTGALIVGGTGGRVEVYTATATKLHALPTHAGWVWGVAAHPAGGAVAVGQHDGAVTLHALDVQPMATLADNLLVFRLWMCTFAHCTASSVYTCAPTSMQGWHGGRGGAAGQHQGPRSLPRGGGGPGRMRRPGFPAASAAHHHLPSHCWVRAVCSVCRSG